MSMSIDQRNDFARRCGTSRGHMTNVAYGQKPCSTDLALRIEKSSGRKITCEQLKPEMADLLDFIRNPVSSEQREHQ